MGLQAGRCEGDSLHSWACALQLSCCTWACWSCRQSGSRTPALKGRRALQAGMLQHCAGLWRAQQGCAAHVAASHGVPGQTPHPCASAEGLREIRHACMTPPATEIKSCLISQLLTLRVMYRASEGRQSQSHTTLPSESPKKRRPT